MNIRIIFIFILSIILFTSYGNVYAQSVKKNSADSAKAARAHIDSINNARKKATEDKIKSRKAALDSIKAAREHAMDSATAAREHKADSIKASREKKTDSIAKARKRVTDSVARIKKYKESKKYRDSVTRAKNAKTKAVTDKRQARIDSIQEMRKHVSDSVTKVRTARTDSIRKRQKNRTDSLEKVKKYKASKRYTDSVTLVRRHRSDSIKALQKNFRDSVAAVRKKSLDSTKKVRTRILDSTKTARLKIMDSIKAVRKAKTDSLAKKKENKEKLAKANEKKKLDALKLKIDLKQKKEREAWSNKTMLKKNWGPKRRLTQNSFTHYNYYFNANRKMEEAELNMRRVSKDNLDSLIGLFPYDPNKDSSLFASDMDSIIRKVSVGIQIHDPRIKWANDMYLLLGQAYYYKGNYENAATSFRYIIASDQKSKNKKGNGKSSYSSYKSKTSSSIVEKKKRSKLAFLQHKSVHNDAILWLARTYNTAGQIENGESVLSLLEYEEDLPENLVGRLHIEKAFAYLKLRNYTEASKRLSLAIDDDYLPNWLKLRVAILNGQILMNTGEYLAASESFEKAIDLYPKIDMDFYARKQIAACKLLAGQSMAEAVPPLKKLLKDAKYSSQFDQVYYVLGSLSAKSGNKEEAIDYFTKSTKAPKASKKQKALSFAALGDVYYSSGKYANAKSSYDSASKYSSGSKDKAIAAAVQRSSGLKEVSGPLATIREQDSLLQLASLSKKDQQAAARKYLRDMEKRRQDSIFNAENASTVSAGETESDKPSEGPAWYFSNPTLLSQGSADFKRKWGNRPLTDNWRRASGQPLAGGAKSENGAEDDGEEDGVEKGDNGLPTEESLLARIPNTPEKKELAQKIQQKAYIMLAKAYTDQLEDYNEAINTLDTLNKRFPAHTQKEEELYLRYRIALKQNKLDKAKQYSDELLKKYPKSQYVNALKPKVSESKATDENTTEVAKYFDQTYDLLMKHQYTEVLMRTEAAKTKFSNPVYAKRFQLTEAMAYAGSGNFDVADSLTAGFIKNNPSDSLTDWAKIVKAYIKDMKTGGKPSWYKEGAAPPPSATAAKKETAAPAAPATPDVEPPPAIPEAPKVYTYQSDSEHYFIAVLGGLDSRTLGFKRAIRSFDSLKFADASLDVLIDMYSMSQVVVQVRKFSNAANAKTYLNEFINSGPLSRYQPGEISTYIISANNYKKMFADKSVDAYKAFYSGYYNK
ncbi:MAG: hypothetical protein JNM41_01950 [Flavipsychrobacter sp.]|nr:hypothetical protein [Flavipsychrobacter sp.]